MARLEVRLLGGFSLGKDGVPLEQPPLRAARSLLAFLILNRDRAHTRDLLSGMFWPDFEESRARRRLSQALWQIQSALGSDGGGPDGQFILGTADSIRFAPGDDFWLDVDEYEVAMGAILNTEARSRDVGPALEAIGLYHGDLLAGFYDDWLFHDQDRLRTSFLGGLRAAVELTMAKGDYEAALTLARRLAQEDEFDEEAHRTVMRVAVLLGRHQDAIRQFEECRRLLDEELGSKPSAETLALYEATLADRDTGGRSRGITDESPLFTSAEKAPFVGREGERRRLAEVLDNALDGRGAVVLVEGESGVGKTRLLAEIAEDARWRGMDVLWGRSAPSGGRPFGPLSDALSAIDDLRVRQLAARVEPPWLEVIEPLLPTRGDADTGTSAGHSQRRADDQQRMHEAITAAMRGLASLSPTLIVIEDVHWADDDTIRALDHLAEHVAGERLVVAVSYRHGEARDRHDVWKLLRELDRLEACERISLTPYSPAQTEELIRRSLSLNEVAQDFSERLHRDTGGIPLFIVETLRALYEKDDLDVASVVTEESQPTRDRLPITPTMHALIRHRLEGLDPASKETLELVAVHDGSLLLEEVIAASALPDTDSLDAIDDLVRRRLLVGADGDFGIEHELMRRVVYDDLPLSRQLDLHRRIALAIEQRRPNEVELLAHHFATARETERAAHYMQRAADHALTVHAYDTAALHLERASEALAQLGAAPDDQFSVACLLEEVLDVLGRRDEQEHALAVMAANATGPEVSDVHRRRAWWLANQDRFAEAEPEAGTALDVARQLDDGGRAVAALTTAGMIACFAGRAAEGVALLEEAVDLDDADERQQADARNALGHNLIDLQRFGEAESQLLAALTLYESIGDARGEAEVLGVLGSLRVQRGQPAGAETAFEQAISISRRIGYRHGEAVNQMNLAILQAITNRLGPSLATFDSAAETYRLMGNQRGHALVQSNAGWLWHALIGDDDHARDLVDQAMGTYTEIGDVRGQAQCLGTLASIEGKAGDGARATALFEQALSLTTEAGDAWLTAQTLREFAYFELEHGDPERGVAHALEAERLCTDHGMNDLVIGVRALLARLLLRQGEVDRAHRAAESAMREIRPGIGFAYMIPFTFAEVLLAEGETEKASRLIATAHDRLNEALAELPEEIRSSALANVPDNAAILAISRDLRGEVAARSLPALDAPAGRPLTAADLVTVEWTLHHPSDTDAPGKVARRRNRLLRLIQEANEQGAAPSLADLVDVLDTSSATVRRDLAELRQDHPTITTHGSRIRHSS